MKKILLLLGAPFIYLFFIGYSAGPAASAGWEYSGGETGLANSAGCARGCHSPAANSSISLTLELDSSGVPVTHYQPGDTYTIRLKGLNNTNHMLPKFGFQLTAIVGANAGASPLSAGTWKAPFPPYVHLAAPNPGTYVLSVLEHYAPILSTTGSGGNGSTYEESLNWTAPKAGTGPVSFWAALNAVNDNASADAGDLWDTLHTVVSELAAPAGIQSRAPSIYSLHVFPNPSAGPFTCFYQLPQSGLVRGKLLNIRGELAAGLFQLYQQAGAQTMTIPRPAYLDKGMYMLVLEKDGCSFSKEIILLD